MSTGTNSKLIRINLIVLLDYINLSDLQPLSLFGAFNYPLHTLKY